jgi:Flp pilus assembly protein TadG
MEIFARPGRGADFCRSERGQSLVEFAVCLPVLLLLVTGIFTFGVAFNQHLQLTDATSVGARLLAISRGQTTDPCASIATAVAAAAPLLKSAQLQYAFVFNGVSYKGPSCKSGSTSTGAAANLVQGATAQVTVTYPCSLQVCGATLVSACVLTAQTAEMIQ